MSCHKGSFTMCRSLSGAWVRVVQEERCGQKDIMCNRRGRESMIDHEQDARCDEREEGGGVLAMFDTKKNRAEEEEETPTEPQNP